MNILICITLLMIIISIVFSSRKETFKIVRKRGKGKVQVGVLNNTPTPIKNLMVSLNSVGGQMVADSKYDTVATDYLDEKNIP
tara:strand:+ start:83 stop:331 length:249 start_codon:yes stop_codon:yes gene_type:complete